VVVNAGSPLNSSVNTVQKLAPESLTSSIASPRISRTQRFFSQTFGTFFGGAVLAAPFNAIGVPDQASAKTQVTGLLHGVMSLEGRGALTDSFHMAMHSNDSTASRAGPILISKVLCHRRVFSFVLPHRSHGVNERPVAREPISCDLNHAVPSPFRATCRTIDTEGWAGEKCLMHWENKLSHLRRSKILAAICQAFDHAPSDVTLRSDNSATYTKANWKRKADNDPNAFDRSVATARVGLDRSPGKHPIDDTRPTASEGGEVVRSGSREITLGTTPG